LVIWGFFLLSALPPGLVLIEDELAVDTSLALDSSLIFLVMPTLIVGFTAFDLGFDTAFLGFTAVEIFFFDFTFREGLSFNVLALFITLHVQLI
jgi:uncharacterized membrane protein